MDGTAEVGLKELFARIEGPGFDAQISAESSIRRVLKVLDSSPELKALTQLLRTDSGVAEAVLSRMARLARTTVDFRFRNKNDSALAAYLYAIVISSPNALLVACRIAITAPNTWLSNQLISMVLSGWASQSNSTEQSWLMPKDPAWNRGVSISSSPKHETTAEVMQVGPIFGGLVMVPDARMNVSNDEFFHVSNFYGRLGGEINSSGGTQADAPLWDLRKRLIHQTEAK